MPGICGYYECVLGQILYNRSKSGLILLFSGFILCFSAFLYTLSRSGWIGFIPVAAIFLFMTHRRRSLLLVMLAIFLFFAPIIIPKTVEKRVRDTFVGKTVTVMGKTFRVDESTMYRIDAAKLALKYWKERPVIGHGVPAGRTVIDVQYTRILHEVGTIGLLIFIWMIVVIFRLAYRVYKDESSDDFSRGLGLSLIAALCGLLVMAWGAEVFIIIRIMEPFWFLGAIVAVLPQLYKNNMNNTEIDHVSAT